MRLDSLQIENFRLFEHYGITFDPQLTVLVGNNGAGKSSLLRAACVAVGTFLASFDSAAQPGISQSDARCVFYDMGEAVDRQEQYPVSISATGSLLGQKDLSWKRSLNTAKGRITRTGARPMLDLSRKCVERLQQGDAALVLPLISYYGTGRLWAKSHQQQDEVRSFSRQSGYSSCMEAGVRGDLLRDWFKKMALQELQRLSRGDKSDVNVCFLTVRHALESCLGWITERDHVSVTFDFDRNDLMVGYVQPNTDQYEELPVNALSDGYRATLSMVADIAWRMAVLNPALGEHVLEQTPGIVMIDEVDLHLHPLWQARILSDLKSLFPRVQFIVTTHAPLVISSVRSSHIRILDPGQATIPQVETYGGSIDRVIGTVMRAKSRPDEVRRRFDEFYRLLDAGGFAQAERVLGELIDLIGDRDSDIVSAQTALALEKDDFS